MLEKEAAMKLCPMMANYEFCQISHCMMWNWEDPENMYLLAARKYRDSRDCTLEELLKVNPDMPKDGWKERGDGIWGWKRSIPQAERHGSCGLAHHNVYVERE